MLQKQAFAAPAMVTEREVSRSHEFSDYTQRLLEVVSVLLQRVKEAREFIGDRNGVEANILIQNVKEALKRVKDKRRELYDEVLDVLNADLSKLKRNKAALIKQSENIADVYWSSKREKETLVLRVDEEPEVKERVDELDNTMNKAEMDYNDVWQKVLEVEDEIERKETRMYSIVIRELSFIERESGLLVENFFSQWKQDIYESLSKNNKSRLSIQDIRKDLESAKNEVWEQTFLPMILDIEDPSHFLNQSTKDFVLNVTKAIQESREMQRNLDVSVRKKTKSYGEEKRFLVSSPAEEVVKGFPEVELKWKFGDKEVIVPKAVRLQLYHGWQKWREEFKENVKRNMMDNTDYGKEYVAQKQERLLSDRDRVVAKTWYNEEKKRWEMDPISVPYAVSKKLVKHVRIRHDWGVLYVALKNDDEEYFVDIKEYDMLFEDFGGFDGLYLKMLASGIPTVVQLMWIPFSELDIRQQFALLGKLFYECIVGFWNSQGVVNVREWCFRNIKNINDDIMVMIGFPLVDLIIPKQIRINFGMAWPEDVYEAAGSTGYLRWQSVAEANFNARKMDSFQWYLWFFIRSIIYVYILVHVLHYLKKTVIKLLGFGPLRSRDPNMRKLRRVKAYFKFKEKRRIRRKKRGIDPIKSAFDQMKRVKNPPMRLRDFASIDSMREEINEIVAFLQNPKAFQELGAQAPRGVLIVGERGTGKTTLALAIAAEAKVPVVKIKAQQLEAGLWVGQSASNVRELFQTARDLAPVIIFVEDFDLFAGVRGQFIHTKKQDHEAFINQLLVELDGFEKQDGVVLIATTRNLKQIDEALRRPGRMDRVLHLQRPTQVEREKILHLAAKDTMDHDLIDFVDWKKVAEKTSLLRPMELKLVPMALEANAFRNKVLDADELMTYVSWIATFSGIIPQWLRTTKPLRWMSRWLVNHLGLVLTKEDIQSVVYLMEPYGQISNGIELLSPPLDWTWETKFPHAVWAAGRGLIAHLLPNFDTVDNIWLEPTSWEGIGCTKITKARDASRQNGNVEMRSYLEKKLVFCFGSYIASQLLLPFGEENYLSSSEIQQAQDIATRMVIQYGWRPDDSPAIYFRSNSIGALSMGDKHEYKIASQVEKIYNSAYDKAKEMLQKNRRVLEVIVEQLMEYEMLTGQDLVSILEEYGGICEQEPFTLSKYLLEDPTSRTDRLAAQT
ncbi:probable inactive ATP-dependent zinc metalloprotease FTSHI 5, chloroplastic isoform X1 [Amborella trichopoda]|uniref:probable inactive ATP-dependent zinc metalloprotease FTSHI 5, chloroplastic isoform X1 n=2 Tax=Amborella trichopoda TaxID=13333 RepID=UPI0005D312F5|nr:probable inactive ATP-dependent zinc metalloprotease FTSHI 5, chloroplastic isoform X1 [Amborella trichopoda]|eukprot:XP_011621119.1 probable inactive ATP-dependent zinc metalloprotease FTSHI 5, chloroplastic isoform X1 [Amborella trichopoda]